MNALSIFCIENEPFGTIPLDEIVGTFAQKLKLKSPYLSELQIELTHFGSLQCDKFTIASCNNKSFGVLEIYLLIYVRGQVDTM